MTKKFYITAAIDYVNSLPHLGTAYEKIGADVVARYHRMTGEKVHFQMGNDEHSANVKKEAVKQGLEPKKYCDEMKNKFEAIWKQLNLSYDDFIQTSETRHYQAVGELFQKILKNGDIYKAPYKGWYCESCEAFYTEKDLSEGNCPTHKSKPKWLEEENYFFKLSSYQKKLLDHYKKHPEFILPEIRRNEVINVVKGGLQDISVSRASFDWGIPLPSDPRHVVYVWFDALINYLTATGFGQKKRPADLPAWPADLHVIGKDITRFHCVIWPAMLMSAGLKLPKTVFGHGFVYLKGEKMSKTLGNIVTPLDVVPQYGADALRYYLLRGSSFGSDGDFTWDDFIKRYNSDLANDLGNLLNRTLGMTNKYLEGKIQPIPGQRNDGGLKKSVESALKKIHEGMDYQKAGDLQFHLILESIWNIVGTADKHIDTTAPWKLSKEGRQKEIQQALYDVVDTLRNIAILIAPFLPDTSRQFWEQLGLSKKLKWEEQTFKNIVWGKTPVIQVTEGKPIFPRIEPSPPAPLPLTGEGGQRPGEGQKKEKPMIEYDEFQKLDLRIAEVKQAEKVEGTDKLLKLQVSLGEESRQIVAGIAQHYQPEELIGKKIVIVANLKPAKIRGVESHGMLLAASDTEGLTVVTPDRTINAGAIVK